MKVQEQFIHFIQQLSFSIEKNEKLCVQLKANRKDKEVLVREYHALEKELVDEYNTLINVGIEDAFYDFIEEEYGEDAELYFLLLEYLIAMTYAQKPVVKFYERKLENGLEDGSILYYLLNLEAQINFSVFESGILLPVERRWIWNKKLTEKMQGELNRNFERILREERNENCVVLAISGLISERHTPIRFVCEMGQILQKYLSKRMVIVNVVLETDEDLMEELGVPYKIMHYWEEYDGGHQVSYREEIFSIYQVALGKDNSGAMAMSLGKPLITLEYGDVAAVAGRDFTVHSLQTYEQLVMKYKNNSLFYDRQRRLALRKIEELTTSDKELTGILQTLFTRVQGVGR